MDCSISDSPRIWSEIVSEATAARLALLMGCRVTSWLISATMISTPPPTSASAPSHGWKIQIPARKNGVHGTSKNAISTGEDISRWIDSRSRSPVVVFSSGCTADLRITASKTRASSRAWNRAATRPMIRPRA